MKKIKPFVVAACLLLFVLCLNAQTGPASATDEKSAFVISHDLPGVPGVTIYNGAPMGFDPTTASDDDLRAYGFPRRPDSSNRKEYPMWHRAISTVRLAAELKPNPARVHRANQKIRTLTSVKSTTNIQSGNWSGYSLVGGSPKFDEVVGIWIVPNVGSQFESFTGYSSMWVGIDGNCDCNDLIQDGTEQEWVNGRAQYYAWIEFIPLSEVVVKNFPVNPGDVIYATSSVGTKNGVVTGFYYMANFNTNVSVSASISMPAGTTFSGESAEWIVERTEVNGSFSIPCRTTPTHTWTMLGRFEKDQIRR